MVILEIDPPYLVTLPDSDRVPSKRHAPRMMPACVELSAIIQRHAPRVRSLVIS